MTKKHEIWFNNKGFTNQGLMFENLYKNQFLVVTGAHDILALYWLKKPVSKQSIYQVPH